MEMVKGKVADTVVVSATTEEAIAIQMEAGDTAATCVTQGRAGKKVKEEVGTGGDAGTTCATEPGPIFSFCEDPLLGLDINECCHHLQMLAGLMRRVSGPMRQFVSMYASSTLILSLHWPRWRLMSGELG